MASNILSNAHNGLDIIHDGNDGIGMPPPGVADPFVATTAGDMNFYLQNLLDKKERQLQQAGNLGQRVLAQQMELEERIRQLQELVGEKTDEEEVEDPQAREKYRELSDIIFLWDAENTQLSSAFGASSKRYQNGNQPSPSFAFAELSHEDSEHKRPQGTAAGQSRRAKNAANRSFIDPEFAMDIGNNLLNEIRRLQSLLTERDKAIQDMKEERDDLEKTVEAFKVALQQQERSSDKYKEENWNLEVTLQELRSQLSDSQASVVRLESELKKSAKTLNTTRDSLDHYKTESEKTSAQLADLKSKHESDVAQARKHAAGLARDKSDLQSTIDQLRVELTRANRRLPKNGSPLTPGDGNATGTDGFITPAGTEAGTEADLFSTGTSMSRRKYDPSGMILSADAFAAEFDVDSPENSPLRRSFLVPNHPYKEMEALQQRLAHAQRQINTLKGSLNKEKMLRIKFEQATSGTSSANGEEGEDLQDLQIVEEAVSEEVETSESISSRGKPRRGGTPFRVGALGSRGSARRGGRGRSGITLIQRLGMAATSPGSHCGAAPTSDEEPGSREPSPPPPIPITFQNADEEEDNFFTSRSSSPPAAEGTTSNRTSVASIEGMDPVFANILRRVPSTSSNYISGSPLRQSLLSRRGSIWQASRGYSTSGGTGRRSRGGVPFKEARPPSLVDNNPSALAAELGLPASPNVMDNESPTVLGAEDSIGEEDEEMRAWRKEVVGDYEEDESLDGAEQGGEDMEDVEMREFGCQTDLVIEKPMKVEVEMQTEPVAFEPLTSLPSTTVAKFEPHYEDMRRATITQADLSAATPVSYSSVGDNTITRSFLSRPLSSISAASAQDDHDEEYDEGEETETGADTADETETETDYYDARASISMVTPSGVSSGAFSESRESFHSVMTVSDYEFPGDSESDNGSIRVMRTGAMSVNGEASGRSSFYMDSGDQALPLTYEDVGVGVSFEPEIVVKEIEVVREVKVEVPVEVVREVKVEVPVEVVKEVEVLVEVIKEVEVVKEVQVECPVEIIREVEVVKTVEVIKEVEVPVEIVKEVEKEVKVPVEVVKEVVKEVPVEVIREVKVEVPVPITVQKDVPVEVLREVEVVKEVMVEVPVTKEVEIIKEVRVEVPFEVPVEVIKEVPIEVEVVREVEKEVIKEVPVEIVREVEKEVVKEVEVVREIPVEVIKEIPVEVIKEVQVEVIKEIPVEVVKEVKVPVDIPRPEVKEMEVQTDVLVDDELSLSFEQSTLMGIPRRRLSSISSVAHGPVFIPPGGLSNGISSPGLFRVGSTGHSQQFQFVASPLTAGVPTTGDAAPILLSRTSRLSTSDRRQSYESGISSTGIDTTSVIVGTAARPVLLNSTDKSKPPIMVLPPPPKAPPPANSMLPPQFIPDRRGVGSSSGGVPPPRPSSPPPPELIQRATTPTFGSVLNVPGVSMNLGAFGSTRSIGGTMSPAIASANLRQLPSTSSIRSNGPFGTVGSVTVERRQFSTTSLALSERSPRSSASSSEHGHNVGVQRNASTSAAGATVHAGLRGRGVADAPSTPNRTMTTDMPGRGGPHQGGGTDPAIIHAITQTMIGEFMYKYTRKAIGKGHGERRHRRFFWIHPYTKTLYWSSSDPGSSNVNESSAKSAYIEGVRSVLDPNPMPPGLYQYSVIVSTPQREMKITAPTKERHDIWLNALKYLLSRPSPNVNNVEESPSFRSPDYLTDDNHEHRRRLLSSPQSFRSSRRVTPGDTWGSTPRGKRSRSQLSVNKGGSVSKRSGTPALEYLRWNRSALPESPYSPTKSFVDVEEHGDIDMDLDFELHDETDGGFEGLENVRACCDGRHTVGHSKNHRHHHHHHNILPSSQAPVQAHSHTAPLIGNPRRQSIDNNQHLDPNSMDLNRPVSPAWSMRSKADSSRSHEGGGLFSWARGEGSKLRFGTRRGVKGSTGPSVDQ